MQWYLIQQVEVLIAGSVAESFSVRRRGGILR